MQDINITLLITSIVGILSFLWTVYQYLDTKRREQDLKEFEIYHKLIKELVCGDSEGTYLDRQAAVVFELRKFERYFSFSRRTLEGLKKSWKNSEERLQRLFIEIDLTLAFLEGKSDK